MPDPYTHTKNSINVSYASLLLFVLVYYLHSFYYKLSQIYHEKTSSANTELLKLFLREVQIFNDLERDLGQYLHKQKRSGRRCSYKISNKKMASKLFPDLNQGIAFSPDLLNSHSNCLLDMSMLMSARHLQLIMSTALLTTVTYITPRVHELFLVFSLLHYIICK